MNRLPRTEEQDARYQNPDNDDRGLWTSSDLTRREYREHDFYPIKLPSGSDSNYWQHGHSTERDFIYITTANLNHEQLQQLSDEIGAERSLLVLCTAFRGKGEYANLTVKKIPRQVLSRCEWGHDDYSLRVENLPQKPPEPGQQDLGLD